MSYWSEIRSDFEGVVENEGDIKEIATIDAWRTDDNNEEGEVIAKVIVTKNDDVVVVYINNIARTDKYAQEVINNTIKMLKEKIPSIPESERVQTLKKVFALITEAKKLLCGVDLLDVGENCDLSLLENLETYNIILGALKSELKQAIEFLSACDDC